MHTLSGPRQPIAPVWHTVAVTALFLAVAIGGYLGSGPSDRSGPTPAGDVSRLPAYVTLIAAEWGLVLFVSRGLRRGEVSLPSIVGEPGEGVRSLVRDFALGLGLWAGWGLVSAVLDRVTHHGTPSSVQGMLPHRALEYVLWVALSFSAGIAEEIVFRGYLLRQFSAWTKRLDLAVLLQAILFGVSHGYQGPAACARITLFGVVFGCFAVWRRSLRPGMVAHALTDIVGGITGG